MTTSPETLAGEFDQLVLTLAAMVESGRDPSPMVAAYGHGRRRWTVVLAARAADGSPDWELVTGWLAQSNADAAAVAADAVTRTVDDAAVYLARTRPREDPEATEALVFSGFVRRGTEVRESSAVVLPYGRSDSGLVRWLPHDEQYGALSGRIADSVAKGLLASDGDNRSEAAVGQMLAAGCLVVDSKGRRRRP